MKKPRELLKSVSRSMDIPVAVGAHLPFLTVQGFDEITIDLQKGLLTYSPQEIAVAVSIGVVTVSGENLRIRYMKEGKIVLCGNLKSISLARVNET